MTVPAASPEMAMSSWEVAVAAQAELGERPVWDSVRQCLIWVDITAGRVHSFREETGDEVVVDLGIAIGAAMPRREGGFVLAAADGFRLTDAGGAAAAGPARPAGMTGDVRFNDGACDPAGRFWAGTAALDLQPGAGALYRLDPDGTTACVLDGVTESNGLGWSPDAATLYYIDSGEPQPRVRAFPFDPATGELGTGRDLIVFAPGDGTPDGLTVDATGCLWIAMWGGGAVRRYSPAGQLMQACALPVTFPTCPGFGSRDLDVLYVTTAREGMDAGQLAAEPLAGHVLRARTGTRGQPVTRYAG